MITSLIRLSKWLARIFSNLPKFTKNIVWPWGSQGEDGVNQIVSMGVDQEISDFLIGDLEIWSALDLIDMSIVVRIDVGSRLFMLL